ncbi:DnaD domain-containing protein [Pullulanibacillus sp. KACC 23026]|uniref:DnaD domain-containing protein n=1 Tax=Pullulanibacillus sp. KACC 23026 TaxID=3028315 RepID=UPI0023B0AAE0|nr:DnaD domain-containing protein [Pullulanibacillus sp. KACC 23026]WEG11331.1 DnaD domain-containing protein [Pullulanibacillus sp. KACC 23026]
MEKKMVVNWLINGTITLPKLLLEHYASIGLNEEETFILIHLHAFLQEGKTFPTPDELAERMTLTPAQCANQLRNLVQRGFLKIEQKANDEMYSEHYSLELLWERLLDDQLLKEKDETEKEDEEALYTIFEKEFGRPLSPIECETLAMWVDQDHHTPQLIVGALREAVISGKLNFRYIDRILFDWGRNGIKTLEQAKAHGERIRGQKRRPASQTTQAEGTSQTVKMYNWLEND